MSYRQVIHRCLGCSVPMEPAQELGQAFERCPGCGAVWIEELALLAMLRAAPSAQHVDELLEHSYSSPRRPCPHCSAPMAHVWLDLLRLDRCEPHGVWLEPGALGQALQSARPVDLSRLAPPPPGPR